MIFLLLFHYGLSIFFCDFWSFRSRQSIYFLVILIILFLFYSYYIFFSYSIGISVMDRMNVYRISQCNRYAKRTCPGRFIFASQSPRPIPIARTDSFRILVAQTNSCRILVYQNNYNYPGRFVQHPVRPDKFVSYLSPKNC